MTKFSNGFYSYSDSYLKSRNKQDLINYIRTIEKNWENALITNDIQYHNCKRLLSEERNKAIEELLEKQLETLENFKYWEDSSGYPIHSLSETQRISKCKELIKQIAQEMKAGGKNE